MAFPGVSDIGESPVWDAADGSLTWVDIKARVLRRWTEGATEAVAHKLDATVSAIALAEVGGFIAATDRGFAGLTLAGGAARLTFAGGQALAPATRMNDGACDRQGRFWAGEMVLWPNDARGQGRLMSLDRSGRVGIGPDRYLIQNGLAWSPDGRVMYVSDSHPDQPAVFTYDYDAQTSTMTNRRLFLAAADMPGRPDGAAIDTDGCYWSASNDAGQIIRVTPAGRVDACVDIPAAGVTNLCFAGPDLRSIYVTSLSRDGRGGEVFVIDDSPWQGLPETPFRGALPGQDTQPVETSR